MYTEIVKKIQLNDGREIEISTGKLAKQADGSVVVKMGKAMLLATVVSAKDANDGVDFMPLSVDYKEKYAAFGRFPGGFIKREGRPSDYEILISRIIDRALRPLFPDDYHAETFVNVTLISGDEDVMPDSLAGLAASAALSVSDIPFNGPISEVRVIRLNGELIVNPNPQQISEADIDLLIGASYDNILMVEGEMNEVSEAEMIEAIKVGHDAIRTQCKVQEEMAKELGITKREYCHEENDDELKEKVFSETYDKAFNVANKLINNKHERSEEFNAVKEEFLSQFNEEDEINESLVSKYYHDVHKKAARNLVLETGNRLDGRKTDEIRQIWCEVDYLPGAHGSSIFTRGETQSLTSVTLGTKMDEQMIDGAMHQGNEKFILHYNFPPFSTGDARPYRGVGRREVGHGNLAHRALLKVIPKDDLVNPYTVRVVSDILESNGSSSMATVCAGTLALMDAGIKINKPVSGIAMGLIMDSETGKYAVLSDILGDEDHLGDMDFKVTGTRDGITATQMDIKIDGLPYEILEKALEQARLGRLHILDKIEETIDQPREDYKAHAPRIEKIIIEKDMIGAVIGPGGKVIQELQKETETTIVIEEVGNKGVIDVFASNKDSITKAIEKIKGIVAVPTVGEIYDAKVKSIMPYGLFLEFLPGKDGLLHISEFDWKRIENFDGLAKEGDIFKVKLIDVDKRTGKFKLSRKVLIPRPPKPEKKEEKKNEE